MRLDEAVEAILAGFVSAIDAAIQDVSLVPLSTVKAVVLGDRARPMPSLPSVWVVPQVATQTRAQYSDETWSLPVSLAALVKADDAEQGGATARQMAAQARTAVLGIMPAGIEGADLTDVVSTSFDPAARTTERNRTLHWVEAVVTVTFTVTE